MSRLTLPVGPRDHILGPVDAPVTLLEYGDYECPFCGQAHVVVAELLNQLSNEMRFTFRHFPLTTVHPHAEHAAEAAEAAGAQGAFWEMHDLLYENQDALEDENLLQYAAMLRLDLKVFTQDLLTHAYAARVREDFMSGVRSGVNGTPAFFINGRRHEGSYDFPTLYAAIQQALATV
jgi:protein-disulfide isomerase